MAIRIRDRTLAGILKGGTITVRRDDPRAQLWDELAAEGIVSTELTKKGLMKISRGNGKSFKPLYKPAAAGSSQHLQNWSLIRKSARAKGQ
jgi:hypothetical protein